MKPIDFDGTNTIFAKDQEGYNPLPTYRSLTGEVVSCWSLSWRERLRVLVTGKIWLSVLTFRQPLQPTFLSTERPDFIGEKNADPLP